MKVVSIIFGLVCVLLLLHFAIISVGEIADNTNMTVNNTNYESYNTAVNTTDTIFVIANTVPYLLLLAAVIAGMLMLLKITNP